MKTFLILFEGMWFVLLVAAIIFVVNLSSKKNYLLPFYKFLEKRIKSKRLLLLLLSAISGVLPIPGRTIISAAMLDTVSPNDDRRKHYGVINYLSTHHYYLWSPLEATVLIPLTVLGLSYFKFISIVLPLFIVVFTVIIFYVFFILKESDVVINNFNKAGKTKKLKWDLLLYVSLIIVISNIVKQYSESISNYIVENGSSVELAGALIFVSSFILGSSGKFAGIVSLLTSVFGLNYLPLFFSLGYSGYLISPMHKCLIINKKYFNLSIRHYVFLLLISTLLITVGYIST